MPKEQETREIARRFRKEGWTERWGKGDHLVFTKNGVSIPVPMAYKELPKGTYRSIAKRAGWM